MARRLQMAPLVLALCALSACAGRGLEAPAGGRNSVGQIDRYLETAVGMSNEGVVLQPSEAMARQTDRTRLNEIAQALRIPFAACFLKRTIETATLVEVPKGEGALMLEGIPQGQLRIRARLNSAGKVLRAEFMEGTVDDSAMVQCVEAGIVAQEFPAVRSNTLRWIDVLYWVSLGYDRGRDSPARRAYQRRQVAEAARVATACLDDRTAPGVYHLRGVSLADREGTALINRIEPNDLPGPVSRCVAQVFRQVSAPPDPESFVRAVFSEVEFEVREDGAVTFADAEWLRLVELEAAARDAERAATERPPAGARAPDDPPIRGVGVGVAPRAPMDPEAQGPRLEGPASNAETPERPRSTAPGPDTATGSGEVTPSGASDPRATDPAESGLQLDLGGRGPRR